MTTAKSVRLLNVRSLRRQPLRALLAAVAIGAGASIALAVVVLSSSINSSLASFYGRVAGAAPLRVVGPLARGGMDDRALAQVRAVPGVADAVPIVQAVTMVEDAGGRKTPVIALGVDCSIQSVVGRFGCDPASVAAVRDTDPPLTSPALLARVGHDVQLRTDAGRLPLSASPTVPALDRFNGGNVVVMPMPQAQRLFGRVGRVDAIYVQPAPGTSAATVAARVREAVPPSLSVLRRGERSALEQVQGPLLPLLAAISVFALGIAAMLANNVLSLSMEERRRDLAVVGAVGGRRRIILLGALTEGAIIGVAGGVLGVVGGVILARPIVASVASMVGKAVGLHLHEHLSPLAVVVAIVAGAATGALAALGPARRATRIDVAAELHGRAERDDSAPLPTVGRALVYTVAAALGVFATWAAQRDGGLAGWQPALATLGLLITAVCAFAAAGRWAPVLLRGALRLLPPTAMGAPRLALANLVRDAKRTAATVIAVATAVGLSATLSSTIPAVRKAVGSSFARVADNRVWVSNLDVNNSASIDAKLSSSQEAALRAVPGVASVDHLYYISNGSRLPFMGVNAIDGPFRPAFPVVRGTATQADLDRGDAIVGLSLARARHLHVGSDLVVETPTGNVPVRVAGIWASAEDNGDAALVSSARLMSLFGPQVASAVYVRPVAGVSTDALAARIEAAHIDPDLRALPPPAFTNALTADIASQLQPFWLLQRALLLVALLAMLSTLLLVGVQRRRELGMLAAVGMGPGSLASMTLTEAGAIGVVGAIGGLVAGLGLFTALLYESVIALGTEPPFGYDLVTPLGYGAIAIVVVIVGAALPAWRTARMQVVDALAYE